ncbi:hypothetical protein ACHHYP_16424 [Achlya hypogyna]|uniref:Uncharacterized protein n=1 Tax=Achlya hypogyna TaxID=1202772 RepID=A0A1V9Y7W8_ACHHY|nr:hypothetical protein ACHHYP_16424 [Achlya hypogyna]
MGIKIRNDTEHDVLVLVFTYVPMPLPALMYRKTLLLRPGTRVDCPTWQSAVRIYAWEANEQAAFVQRYLEKSLGKINSMRMLFAAFGGEIITAIGDVFSAFGESIMDHLIGILIETAMERAMERLDEVDDDDFRRMQQRAVQNAQAGAVRRQNSMTNKLFLFTQNALFLRRQFSVHRNRANALEINGAGMSWFS